MGRATGGRRTVALLLFLALIIAACGDGEPTPPPSATATIAPSTPTPSLAPSPTASAPALTAPPGRDLIDLAMRFRGLPADAPRLARLTPYAQQVGDSQQFFVLDLEAPAMLTITATLRHISQHAYFFVEDGVPFSAEALQRMGADFDELVYPAVTAAFGSEWTPGVDSDPRMTFLHARLKAAGGYFSLSDEFPLAVVPRSNEREVIYVDQSYLGSPGVVYNSLLAHELQHMVHWNADPDEESWVNEGLSQIAAELVGGGTGGVGAFLGSPDTQLNGWPVLGDDPSPHYAGSQLFFRYLLDRFGGREKAVELLRIRDDDIAGVEAYLKPFEVTFLNVFADWLVANYLDEESGPYAHLGADARVGVVTVVDEPGAGRDSVHQFAADYLEVDPPEGGATFRFDGADEVSIGIPPDDGAGASGGAFWWSNRGDGIDSRLTREFDLTGLEKATLRFRTWFDIEQGWDYAYVAASTDGGATWRALPGGLTSDYDPVGQAYGPGYTGSSGSNGPAWRREEIDLTEFVGGRVLLRWEYVTDDSANLVGLAVDDVEVPELGFFDTADSDAGWTVEGFRRVEGPLPQRFLLQLIEGAEPARVTRIALDDRNVATLTLDGPATIVVAAVTEGTSETAGYSWSLTAP